MLEENRKITVNGESNIDGKIAERYTASIDEMNPGNITFSRIIVDAQFRKDNREQCRVDQAQFEDDAYAIQDEMLAQDNKKEDVEEEQDEDDE